MAEMGAQMRAVRLQQVRLPVLSAEQHQVFAKVVQRLNAAWRKLPAVSQGEPAEGDGKCHGLLPVQSPIRWDTCDCF